MTITYSCHSYYHALVGNELYLITKNGCEKLFEVELEWDIVGLDYYYIIRNFW